MTSSLVSSNSLYFCPVHVNITAIDFAKKEALSSIHHEIQDRFRIMTLRDRHTEYS